MSLNGLDDPKVQEAHEAAVAEPGGWYVAPPKNKPSCQKLTTSCAFVAGSSSSTRVAMKSSCWAVARAVLSRCATMSPSMTRQVPYMAS